MKKNLFIVMLFLTVTWVSQATVRYVKIGGTTIASNAVNATSWDSACPDLQAVIGASGAGDTVWVASGTYKPSSIAGNGTTNRDKAFVLKKDVKIFGGFAGTETNLAQRGSDSPMAVSVLSGDIDNNNILDIGNAYHVVIGAGDAGTAQLDGFTIKGGYADDEEGGLISVNGFDIPRLSGGGISLRSSSPLLSNLVICENSSASDGGGIYLRNLSSPTLLNISIKGNKSDLYGGGISNFGECIPTLINVAITGNKATEGGGIYNMSFSSPTLVNVTISGNAAALYGGIYNYNSSSAHFYNSIVWGNGNGNVGNAGADPNRPSTYAYSLVDGETTSGINGNISGTDPFFVQYVDAALAPTTTGDYSLQAKSPVLGAGNNAAYLERRHLTNFTGEKDLAGNNRLFAGIIDLGAYEYPVNIRPDSNGIIYVKAGGAGDGSSWANAYPDLAYPLMIAQYYNALNQIWVAGGTYYPEYKATDRDNQNLLTTDRDKAFVLLPNIKIYGGFAGTETSIDQRNGNVQSASVLSGDINRNNQLDNGDVYHVAILAGNLGTAVLDGFTIIGGNANGDNNLVVNGASIQRNAGGGIICNTSALFTLNKVVIKNNFANSGGGIYAASPLTLNTVTVNNNTATFGGGIYNTSTLLTQNEVTIKDNSAQSSGGGIYNTSSQLTLNNAIISGNSAQNGGGIANEQTALTLSNVLINNNKAQQNGGGIHTSSPLTLNAATISDNTATFGGGIYTSSQLTLNAVTVNNNTATFGGGIYNTSTLLTQNEVTIKDNSAQSSGGGIYNTSSQLTLNNAIISGNSAQNGGGIANEQAAPTLSNVLINNNKAQQNGGGIYTSSPLTLNAATISGNTAASGGGIYTSSQLTLNAITVNNNTATFGGGIYNTSTLLTQSGVIIKDNSAQSSGGGIYNTSSQLTLNNAIISGNSAQNGGGITNDHAAPNLINVLINNNKAQQNGGGIMNLNSASPSLTNLTISGNSASLHGGGIYNTDHSSPVLANAIVWGNENSSVYNGSSDCIPSYLYSLVQGCGGSNRWNSAYGNNRGGNLDLDPLFTDASIGNYALMPCSPAIDGGNNDYYLSARDIRNFTNEVDLAGNPRLKDSSIDMGVYEAQTRLTRPTLSLAPSQTITYGASVNIFTLSGTSPWTVVYDDGSGSRTLSGLTASSYLFTPQAVGSYSFTPLSVQDANCVNTDLYGTSVITVGKASQTINFHPATTLPVEGATYTLTATSTSGSQVLFKLRAQDADLAEITNTNQLRLKQSGSIVVTAYTVPNPNFSDAPEVSAMIMLTSNKTVADFTVQGASKENDIYVLDGSTITVTVTTADRNATIEYLGQSYPRKTFTVEVDKAGTQIVVFTVISQDGSRRQDYHFYIEKKLDFDSYVATKWNNSFILNVRKLTEGGFQIKSCRWFENEQQIGDELTYSKGDKSTDTFKIDAVYSFKIETQDGIIRSSGKVFTPTSASKSSSLHVYPNPVASSQSVFVETEADDKFLQNAPIRVYSLTGTLIKQVNAIGRRREINLSVPTGTYFLRVGDKEIKLIVK
jgi:predicted outer membrane repeat protein